MFDSHRAGSADDAVKAMPAHAAGIVENEKAFWTIVWLDGPGDQRRRTRLSKLAEIYGDGHVLADPSLPVRRLTVILGWLELMFAAISRD